MITIIKVLYLILTLKSNFFESVIIETTNDQTDQQCDFYNQTLVNKVWFVKSPYNCRVYHLCAYYKQFTLTCAEGLYFDESLDSCNFEALVDCPENAQPKNNNNNFEFLQPFPTNSQSDFLGSGNQYYYNAEYPESVENSESDKNNQEYQKSGSQSSTNIFPNALTNSTTATTTSTTTTITSTKPTNLKTTPVPTYWYQPYTPVTFLLFTYKNDRNYQSSKKVDQYPDSIQDSENVIYNVKSQNLFENNDELLTKPDNTFKMPTKFEESNEYKVNDNVYGISSAYNQNLNKEINKFFDSLTENQYNSTKPTVTNYFTTKTSSTLKTIASTLITSSSTNSILNTKIDLETIDRTKINAWWLAPKKCMSGFSHRLSNSQNCALYYECHSNGDKIEKACPYPSLYDEYLNECRSYDQVECGNRFEAKNLCDYELSLVNKNKSKCNEYPDCRNLKDGLYPSDDCKNFFQCKDERTLRQLSCPFDAERNQSLRFNILTRRCDHIENTPINCGGYSIKIDIYTGKMVCPISQTTSDLSYELKDVYYKHPTKCNLFIECDKGNMTVLECPNGTHFSSIYQSCVHPSISNCNATNIQTTSIYASSSTSSSTTSSSPLLSKSSNNLYNDEPQDDHTTNSIKLNDSINFSKEDLKEHDENKKNKTEYDNALEEDEEQIYEEEGDYADYDEYENMRNVTTFLDTNHTTTKLISHITTQQNDMVSLKTNSINQLIHQKDNIMLLNTTTNINDNKFSNNLTNYTTNKLEANSNSTTY